MCASAAWSLSSVSAGGKSLHVRDGGLTASCGGGRRAEGRGPSMWGRGHFSRISVAESVRSVVVIG